MMRVLSWRSRIVVCSMAGLFTASPGRDDLSAQNADSAASVAPVTAVLPIETPGQPFVIELEAEGGGGSGRD